MDFLRVSYQELAVRVAGGWSDNEALEWCFATGHKPTEQEVLVWNEFMRKRGWNDEATETLDRRKTESGLSDRDDIRTMFDYIEVDEGRF